MLIYSQFSQSFETLCNYSKIIRRHNEKTGKQVPEHLLESFSNHFLNFPLAITETIPE